ncbi:MAG TPA: hypothetical protein VGH90_12325 [Chthoniobacteraceae bacterium]
MITPPFPPARRLLSISRRSATWSGAVAIFCMLVGLFIPGSQSFADDYHTRRDAILARDPMNRRVPVIPPKEKKMRVIIDSDTRTEIDDVWAIALALCAPERFQIEGFVGANFDGTNAWGGPRSVEGSAELIETILDKAGLKGRIPVKRGSAPMQYQYQPIESEGVDFIIDKAMASSVDDPLWIIGLGAATDIASAYLKEPRIVEHINVSGTSAPIGRSVASITTSSAIRAPRVSFSSRTCPLSYSTRAASYSVRWNNPRSGRSSERSANSSTHTGPNRNGFKRRTKVSSTSATSRR